MKRRHAGFTLLEILIALAIVMLVLFAAITFFIASVKQFKVQTKIIETNLEGILGLELFRQDLESLGFGLPWNQLPGSYTERPGAVAAIAALNESPNAPRAVAGINGATFTVNQSDYLVIRSARVGMKDAAGKWTNVTRNNDVRIWVPSVENLVTSDYVIVLAVGSADSNRRSLVNPTSPYTTYSTSFPAAFLPVDPYSANIVYGIDNVLPVRPFNRADYYIDNTSVPEKCAPNTGVLVKAVIAHDGSGTPVRFPLLDCAADMQVVYGLDTNADGVVETWEPDLQALFPVSSTAAVDLRGQLAEIRVHILAQEGQRDDSYRTPTDSIFVGSQSVGRSFDVSGYRNYRWKLYSIVVKPKNLAQ